MPTRTLHPASPGRRQFIASGAAVVPAMLLASGPAAAPSAPEAPPHDAAGGIAPFGVEGGRLVVPAGIYDTGRVRVNVPRGSILDVPPANIVKVEGEELKLSEKPPAGFFAGTKLRGTLARSIGAFRALIDESVTVRDLQGRPLVRGEDFLVSAPFALLGLGPRPRVTADTPVLVSYSHYLQRIDSVAVDSRGGVSLLAGTPALVSPEPPSTPRGSTVIARVYRPFRATTLLGAHVFPLKEAAGAARTATTPGLLPKTARKLLAGEPVTVVCWGDSITVGADVEPHEAWANLLGAELRKRFPRVNLTLRNHSIGGTKSAQWLHNGDYPGLPRQDPKKCRLDLVLAEKPDLVVMEFLNDIVLREEALQSTYAAVDAEFARHGIEWLIVTPSLKIPEHFEPAAMKDDSPRLLDEFLVRFAREKGHAIADAAARWRHLGREGTPYFALFNNAYNHPNAFGHRLFVEEIMRCMPRH